MEKKDFKKEKSKTVTSKNNLEKNKTKAPADNEEIIYYTKNVGELIKKAQEKQKRKNSFETNISSKDNNAAVFYNANDSSMRTINSSEEKLDYSEKLFRKAMIDYSKMKDLNGLMRVIKMLEEVVNINSSHLEANYNLGVFYLNLKEYDKALTLLTIVLKMEDDLKSDIYENTLYNLGNLYLNIGEFEKSKEFYEKVLELRPKAMDVLFNLGLLCLKHLGDYDRAIEVFDFILKMSSINYEALYNKALAYLFKDDKDKAFEILEHLLRIKPDYAPAYYNLGMLSKDMGRKDKAKIYLKKYLTIPKNYSEQNQFIKIALRRLRDLEQEKL